MTICDDHELNNGLCICYNNPVENSECLKVINYSQVDSSSVLFHILTDVEEYILGVLNIPVFHGGAVTKGNNIIFLIGERKAGKTTLINYLINRGWSLIDDDCIYIGENGIVGFGFPLRARKNLFPENSIFAYTVDSEGIERILIDVFNSREEANGNIIILFPKYSLSQKFEFKSISKSALFTNLLKNLRFSENDIVSLKMIIYLMKNIKSAIEISYSDCSMVERFLDEVLE